MTAPALRRSIRELVEEYDAKRAAIPDAISAFNAATTALDAACCLGGTWAGSALGRSSSAGQHHMEGLLLQSAWKHVYSGLQIERLASAQDKRKFEQMLAKPPAFTLTEIRDRLGVYLLDPRHHILRGLAEVFCDLDPAYRSHSKVKIGVAGLPKRVILSSVGGYGSYGRDKLRDILNALASYQGQPLMEHKEFEPLDGLHSYIEARSGEATIRGLRIKKFQNGNAHLIFDADTLKDINRALAEFYGEVLPDVDERPAKARASTAVSKDLQYYPTPKSVAERVVSDIYIRTGERVLEPSCGCGRLMDAIRDKATENGAVLLGIEVDPARAAEARAKGHAVQVANFLETVPTGDFDHVVMNPPFYGKHYAKHVEHALKYLKPDGRLTAILPASARYDHGLLDGRWTDLPVGAFSESGTNVNTVVLTIHAARARAAA